MTRFILNCKHRSCQGFEPTRPGFSPALSALPGVGSSPRHGRNLRNIPNSFVSTNLGLQRANVSDIISSDESASSLVRIACVEHYRTVLEYIWPPPPTPATTVISLCTSRQAWKQDRHWSPRQIIISYAVHNTPDDSLWWVFPRTSCGRGLWGDELGKYTHAHTLTHTYSKLGKRTSERNVPNISLPTF